MPSINHLLNQQVTIENPTGERDGTGKIRTATPTTYRARVERVHKTIARDNQETEPIHLEVFLAPQAVVVRGAKLTYGGVAYRVIEVSDEVGKNGSVHHYELMCQRWV